MCGCCLLSCCYRCTNSTRLLSALRLLQVYQVCGCCLLSCCCRRTNIPGVTPFHFKIAATGILLQSLLLLLMMLLLSWCCAFLLIYPLPGNFMGQCTLRNGLKTKWTLLSQATFLKRYGRTGGLNGLLNASHVRQLSGRVYTSNSIELADHSICNKHYNAAVFKVMFINFMPHTNPTQCLWNWEGSTRFLTSQWLGLHRLFTMVTIQIF